MMLLESIRIVTEAEKKASKQLEDAKTYSRAAVSDGEAKGRELAEQYRQRAMEENKRLMAEVERHAEDERRNVLERTAAECEVLEAKAQLRLEAAAKLIVERIVNG